MLNEAQIKNSKPKIKKYLLNDSKGLYLRVDKGGFVIMNGIFTSGA